VIALERAADLAAARRRVLATLWLTYAIYYLGRLNLGAALPGLCDELGYTKAEIGWVLAFLKIGYAVGQLVNGQLADRRSARKLLAIGLAGSAACNLAFGASAGLHLFAFLWLTNGYFQAMGWTPCVKVLSRFTAREERGRAMGLLGTSYQVGTAAILVLSGHLVEWTGDWRSALYVPSALLLGGALMVWFSVRDRPEDVGLPAAAGAAAEAPGHLSVRAGLRLVLGNGSIWLLALSLAALNCARYGFLDWAPTHLREAQGVGIDGATLQAALLPAGGVLGAYSAGWISDRLFAARRAPVMVCMLAALALLTVIYDPVARASAPGALVLLAACGFLILGPHVLLVGTAPAELARGGAVASAAGFVDMMGYVGAAAGDAVTGVIAHDLGWERAVWFWAAAAALAALFLVPLWLRGR
jgi:OPA family glycerol-3-phosphate transporter-like MFS transporter